MSTTRRVTLPGADELFRSTSPVGPAKDLAPPPPASSPMVLEAVPDAVVSAVPAGHHVSRAAGAVGPRVAGDRAPTGREKHDKKITVYLSPAELVELERARLVLSGDHGLYIDRGRIVREALAVVLADLEDKGGASILVRRLHST